jgi:hypothetical protein
LAAEVQFRQRLARIEALVHVVPPVDRVAFAHPPAQPDGAPAGERREVNQSGVDVAQGDAPLVDLSDRGLHPPHGVTLFALHLRHFLGVLGRPVRLLALLDLRLQRGHAVAVGLELLEQRLHVGQPLVCLVNPEIARHRAGFSHYAGIGQPIGRPRHQYM